MGSFDNDATSPRHSQILLYDCLCSDGSRPLYRASVLSGREVSPQVIFYKVRSVHVVFASVGTPNRYVIATHLRSWGELGASPVHIFMQRMYVPFRKCFCITAERMPL